jgi:hypothetical protein
MPPCVVAVLAPASLPTSPHLQLRPVIPVVGDIYIISFGANDFDAGSSLSLRGPRDGPILCHCEADDGKDRQTRMVETP